MRHPLFGAATTCYASKWGSGMRAGASLSRPLTVGRKLTNSFVILVLSFLIAEGLVRAMDLDRRIMGNPYEGNAILAPLQADPFLQWRGRAGIRLYATDERFNSRGFRTPEILPKGRGVQRIAVLGDSCTFGFVRSDKIGLDLPKPYPAQLQELLDRSEGPGRYEVVNYGTIGYSTFHGLRILRKEVLHDDPDFVVIRFGFNDHLASPVHRSYSSTRSPAREALEDTLSTSRVLSLLFFFRGNPVPDFGKWRSSAHPIVWVAPEDYDWHLSRMIDLSRAHGARPILLDAPAAPLDEVWQGDLRNLVYMSGYETIEQYYAAHDRYQSITVSVARTKGVPFVRTAAPSSETRSYFSGYDIVHPTAAGHERIARMLYAEISSMVAREQGH